MNSIISHEKELMRKQIWDLLYEKRLSKRSQGDHNKIPYFKGSAAAAERLAKTIEWSKCQTIFCSPDSAQKKVRELVLKQKINLIMATPKLKDGYLLLNGKKLEGKEKMASTIGGAFKYGKPVNNLPIVDLVVEGSVAVDKNGNRLGKGGGFGDREINHLFKEKSIKTSTPIVTTIHPQQILPKVPVESHDQKINMIVTPNEVIRIFQDPKVITVK